MYGTTFDHKINLYYFNLIINFEMIYYYFRIQHIHYESN